MQARTTRIGVLSTITAPLLPALLQQLYNHGLSDIVVILDSRALGSKDLDIFQQRTHGAFDDIGVTLYDFAALKLPFYFVPNHNGTVALDLFQALDCAVLLNGGTPRKLSRQVLDTPLQGVINVHPGVLPKYRGSSCVEWAIYNDEAVGNTAHFMSEGYDDGPIIKVESYEFPQSCNYVDIRVHVYREAQRLMAETARDILASGIKAVDCPAQPEGQLFRPIGEEEMAAVLRRVEEKNYRFVRAT